MKRRVFFLSFAGLLPASGQNRVSRVSIAAVEKMFDRRLEREVLDGDPLLLIGMTRGVYIDGFGAVYSSEVNLVPGLVSSPFRPEASREETARLRQRKLERLPVLRRAMKRMMVDSAATLEGMAPSDQFVYAVSIYLHPREDSTGIPSQIVMQAQNKALLDAHAGRLSPLQLDRIFRVQEF